MRRTGIGWHCHAALWRCVSVAASAWLLAGCATASFDSTGVADWSAHADDAVEVGSCRALLAARTSDERGLNGDDFRLLNWNVQKGKDEGALLDLYTHSGGSDLILLQEAALRHDFLESHGNAQFWSFAPGYETGAASTGVLTLSATMPVARCSLVSYEPWLRTPKATSITQFALRGSDATLVVVNMHAINFTFGTRRFAEQFRLIGSALRRHRGPIILSGDFNTWRPGRQRIVDELATGLGLHPVRFTADERKQVFGNVLDHVYARGLVTLESRTAAVTSSDHNPMFVRFARLPAIAQ